MKSLLLIASALLSVISANRVIHLDSDNFDTIVDGSRNVFVKFEASWCGPCKRIAPILDQVAREAFPDLDGDTVLAAIDADEEREIGDRFQIEAFPTIKLFLKGRPQEEAIDFVGERSPQGFVRFIKDHVAVNMQSLPEDIKLSPPTVPLTQILADLARAGPKPLATNEAFASGLFEEKSFHLDQFKASNNKQKNLKQRKDKNRKNKQQRANKEVQNFDGPDSFPLVNTEQAKNIISTAGSRPVLLIFFSPSNQKSENNSIY